MVCEPPKQLLIISCYLNSTYIEKILIEETIQILFIFSIFFNSQKKFTNLTTAGIAWYIISYLLPPLLQKKMNWKEFVPFEAILSFFMRTVLTPLKLIGM